MIQWTLVPSKSNEIEREVLEWSRQNAAAIRRSMRKPSMILNIALGLVDTLKKSRSFLKI